MATLHPFTVFLIYVFANLCVYSCLYLLTYFVKLFFDH